MLFRLRRHAPFQADAPFGRIREHVATRERRDSQQSGLVAPSCDGGSLGEGGPLLICSGSGEALIWPGTIDSR